MTKPAFNDIAAGLNDAIAHARGDQARARTRSVQPIDVQTLRNSLDMTQAEFAAAIGVSLATVRNWEQHSRVPHGPARVLLQVIATEPEAAKRALLKKAPQRTGGSPTLS